MQVHFHLLFRFVEVFNRNQIVCQHRYQVVITFGSASAVLVNPQTSLEAIHNGHVDVQNNQVEKVIWIGGHNLKRLKPIFGFLKVKVFCELERVRHADESLIVNE